MTVERKPPMPWNKGTGASGMYCKRIVTQMEAGKLKALLPLAVIEEEEVPTAGDTMIILTAPVRGIPFIIAKVQLLTLGELTDSHYEEIGMEKAAYLNRWNELNPKRLAESDPKIMLLWLVCGRLNKC